MKLKSCRSKHYELGAICREEFYVRGVVCRAGLETRGAVLLMGLHYALTVGKVRGNFASNEGRNIET